MQITIGHNKVEVTETSISAMFIDGKLKDIWVCDKDAQKNICVVLTPEEVDRLYKTVHRL